MAAGKHNIIIDQGSDFAEDYVIKENGVVKDLTGYTARAQMRATKSSSTISATFTCTIATPANGSINMSLGHALSSALTPGKFYWDIEIYTAGEASVTRLLQGEALLTTEVTR